jgi:hypothetical protein
VDVGDLVAFLGRQGRRRQFAVCHSEADFAPGSAATLDLVMEDLFVARPAGAIVDARDPLAPVARRPHPIAGPSRVSAVSWDGGAFEGALDQRPARPEVATL